MTEKTFSLNYEIIEQLFQNSVCLSYNPTEPMRAWQYAKELETDFKKQNNVKRCRVVSKTAKIWQRSYHPRFHYFSDGSLLFPRYLAEKGALEELDNVKHLLKIRGYKINKIYAPQTQIEFFTFDKMLRFVSEQAWVHYPFIDDLSVEPFPNKEDFVQECFVNGNILLTASKHENVFPACRQYLAVFADGRFFVAENYGRRVETANFSKILQFENKNQNFLRTELEYVPQDYIDALYMKASEFEWYETPEDAAQKQKLSFNKLQKMRKYIDNLFENRKCVSVLNPENKDVLRSPDLDNYALFSDGLLIITQSCTKFDEDSVFMKDLHKIYPNYDFTVEQVPDFYVPEIYNSLPQFQKGAATIYVEMLKQKARKLKRMLEIPHHKALDIAAQIAGWKNWKDVKIEDEPHARHLIHQEMWRKQYAVEHNAENPLMWEYTRWQIRQKHSEKQ